jgi:hypothetical protein
LAGKIYAEHRSRQNLRHGAFDNDLFFLRHFAANIRANMGPSRLAPSRERRSLVRRSQAIWRSPLLKETEKILRVTI